jgi:hypothetical protein
VRDERRTHPAIISTRAEHVLANRRESAEVAVSTRTYIVLAALTGVVILVAFAVQVVLAGK